MLSIPSITPPIFAILTPFQANGQIDFGALTDYLHFLQEKGVKSLITNGTTAEFPSLSLQERKALLKHCRTHFQGTILNHISNCCIEDCLELKADSQNQAEGIILLPPFYYAQSPEQGLLKFFLTILSTANLPSYIYNFPKHTQNQLSPQLINNLLQDCPQIMGIKDSEGNLAKAKEFKTLKEGNFEVFVGGDGLVLKVLQNGLNGSITGGGNPFPEFLLAITEAYQKGQLPRAEERQSALNLWNAFRKQCPLGEIPMSKAALRYRIKGFPTFVRPPLQEVAKEEWANIDHKLETEIIPFLSHKN